MKCVNIDNSLSNIPPVTKGSAESQCQWKQQSRWVELACAKCGKPIHIKRPSLERWGTERWNCRDCKRHDKLIAIDAALAVVARKKKMGIRW